MRQFGKYTDVRWESKKEKVFMHVHEVNPPQQMHNNIQGNRKVSDAQSVTVKWDGTNRDRYCVSKKQRLFA